MPASGLIRAMNEGKKLRKKKWLNGVLKVTVLFKLDAKFQNQEDCCVIEKNTNKKHHGVIQKQKKHENT